MTEDPSTPPQPGDWAGEYRLDVLLARADVRAMVGACAQNARIGMSGEEFLLRVANATQLVPIPGARSLFLNAVVRGRERALSRGYQTGKSQSAAFAAPIGHVITAVLCSLARNSQAVTGTEQLEGGCVLTADIPSDRKTFGGILTIAIGPTPNGTAVESSATIPGQLYDWGKCKKVLSTLVADVPALLPT